MLQGQHHHCLSTIHSCQSSAFELFQLQLLVPGTPCRTIQFNFFNFIVKLAWQNAANEQNIKWTRYTNSAQQSTMGYAKLSWGNIHLACTCTHSTVKEKIMPSRSLSRLHHLCQFSVAAEDPLDWIVQCFTSPPTQYRLYGRRFLQVRRPNEQYQSTEGESRNA